MQTIGMGKDAEIKTRRQADLADAQADSVALAALRRRQSRAGFALRTLNWEEGGEFRFWYQKISFRAEERRC